MNKGLIIGLSAVAVVGGIVAYRYFFPPSFNMKDSMVVGCGHGCRKIEGAFDFGNKKNVKFDNFNLEANGKELFVGRSFMNFGWNLAVFKGNDAVIFELQKNGKKIKTLKRLV